MSKTIIPVILAGGFGSRLWPLSRQALPKQLLPLLNNQSLLQNTLERTAFPKLNVTKPIVITNTEFRFLVAEQLREIHCKADIILEPVARNTAPAVAIAAIHALQLDPKAILLVLPADHAILNQSAWIDAIEAAHQLACDDYLVTLGISPNAPSTGYGYIKPGKNLDLQKKGFQVDAFIEKPNLTQAEEYIQKGYFWNSGIFMFSASNYLAELEKFQPDMKMYCDQALKTARSDLDFIQLGEQAMQSCPSNSVDYAVMEKTAFAAVIPVDMDWSDIGSWTSLHEISKKDSDGNSVIGDVIQIQTKNSYLRAENRMLAVLGLEDCILIETSDVVLAAHKDYSQQVKEVVNQLTITQRAEVKTGSKVFRPWGWYETVTESSGFKVKEIMVNPGAKLSLQMHQHRSEHWVIVSGDALVRCEDTEFTLQAGQSTFIPVKTKHRLSNLTELPLHIIEVQRGNYLGEDDIERFEDVFGRAELIV